MSRQQISLEAMQALCQFWLNEPSPRKILNAHPELKPIIPRIEHALQTLLDTDQTKDQRLKKLSQQAKAVDAVHDDLIRLLLSIFDVLSALSPDNDSYEQLSDWMFPEGASHTTETYETEVGHALRIEQELPTHKKALAAIKIDGITVLSVVERYLQAARDLGSLEQQKETENQPTKIRAARTEWLQVVRLLVATVRVLNLSPGDTNTLLGRLKAASTKKAAKATSTSQVPPSPTQNPAPTTEPENPNGARGNS